MTKIVEHPQPWIRIAYVEQMLEHQRVIHKKIHLEPWSDIVDLAAACLRANDGIDRTERAVRHFAIRSGYDDASLEAVAPGRYLIGIFRDAGEDRR